MNQSPSIVNKPRSKLEESVILFQGKSYVSIEYLDSIGKHDDNRLTHEVSLFIYGRHWRQIKELEQTLLENDPIRNEHDRRFS